MKAELQIEILQILKLQSVLSKSAMLVMKPKKSEFQYRKKIVRQRIAHFAARLEVP
jgi:hypothetical protein